jgi:hypothetical protein
MAAWKALERTVAKKLGGKRIYRGADFSKSLPDVDHPLFALECKYRKGLPKLYTVPFDLASLKLPEALLVKHEERVVFPLDALVRLVNKERVEWQVLKIEKKKYSTFLEAALKQSAAYDGAWDKYPMVIMKEREMRGELVYMPRSDFEDLRGSLCQIQ